MSARRWRALLGRAQRWARARVGLAMDGDSTSKLPRPAWPAVGWGSSERAALARNHFIFFRDVCAQQPASEEGSSRHSPTQHLAKTTAGHLVCFSRDNLATHRFARVSFCKHQLGAPTSLARARAARLPHAIDAQAATSHRADYLGRCLCPYALPSFGAADSMCALL